MLTWSWSEKKKKNGLEAFIDNQIFVYVIVAVAIHMELTRKVLVRLNGHVVQKGKLDLHMVIIWDMKKLQEF